MHVNEEIINYTQELFRKLQIANPGMHPTAFSLEIKETLPKSANTVMKFYPAKQENEKIETTLHWVSKSSGQLFSTCRWWGDKEPGYFLKETPNRSPLFAQQASALDWQRQNSKKAVFKDHTGAEVFMGETIHGVALKAHGKENIIPFTFRDHLNTPGTNRKWFKNIEDAQNYLKQNVKRFSIKDIEAAMVPSPMNTEAKELFMRYLNPEL